LASCCRTNTRQRALSSAAEVSPDSLSRASLLPAPRCAAHPTASAGVVLLRPARSIPRAAPLKASSSIYPADSLRRTRQRTHPEHIEQRFIDKGQCNGCNRAAPTVVMFRWTAARGDGRCNSEKGGLLRGGRPARRVRAVPLGENVLPHSKHM